MITIWPKPFPRKSFKAKPVKPQVLYRGAPVEQMQRSDMRKYLISRIDELGFLPEEIETLDQDDLVFWIGQLAIWDRERWSTA